METLDLHLSASQCGPWSHVWLEPCGLLSPTPRDAISRPLVACAGGMLPEALLPLLSVFLVEEIKQKMSCPQVQDSADR